MDLSREGIVEGLRRIVAPADVVTDEKILVQSSVDNFRKLQNIFDVHTMPVPAAIAMVHSAEQVAAILRFAAEHGVNVIPRTGGTGSVGVICMHVDMSKALGAAGVNVTLIHYGDRKADGSDSQPLSKEAMSRYQSDVDAMGELFVKTVARNRGLSVKAVRDTQATTFLGAAGVEIGFADAVMAPDEAFRSLLAELG